MGRKKKAYLPTMEPESLPDIDSAADSYVDVRDRRMALIKSEVEAHDELLALLKKHKLSSYEYDGYIVSVVSSDEKVKVKRKSEPEEEEGEE